MSVSTWYLNFVERDALLLAAAILVAGLAALYFAWRRSQRNPALVTSGWLLIAGSLYYWVPAAGFDAGPAMGTVVLMLTAIAIVLATGQWRSNGRKQVPPKNESSVLQDVDVERRHRTIHTGSRFVAAGPLALSAALAIAMLMVARSSWTPADRLMGAAGLMLLLWAAGMVWVCATRKLVAPVVAMIACIFVGLVGVAWP